MRGWRVTLALCVVGAWCAAGGPAQRHRARAAHAQPAPDTDGQQSARSRRSTAGSVDRWSNLIADYTRGAGGAGGVAGGWIPPPMPIYVPLPSESGGRGSGVSLLVVPVPFPVHTPRTDAAQCQLNAQQTAAAAAPTNADAPARSVSVIASNDVPGPAYANTASNPPAYGSPPYNSVPANNQVPAKNPDPIVTNSARPVPAPAPVSVEYEADSVLPQLPSQQRYPPQRPAIDERLTRNVPKFPPVEDSRLLVEQFRAQEPADPMLPPVVIDPVGVVSTDDYTVEELQQLKSSSNSLALEEQSDSSSGDPQASPERRRLKCKRRKSDPEDNEYRSPPPLPRFERPLYMRARLSVPRADYTEPYSVWWDAASGASRVDFHGGTASSYRMMQRDGRVRSILMRVDRTGETDVRRCVVSAPRRVTLEERALPVLPDLQAFSFAGYVQRDKQRLERWRHTLSGHSGELGGVRGEALTFRHELLVTRSADNYTTTPLWYSVRVDSSVLGADCDGYVHYFDDVQTRHHDTAMFNIEIADACEQVDLTNRMDSVEPLREFTMLRRDPRYDAEYYQYKKLYERRYADDIEEAVRKNVLMQTLRYTSSGNRQGASFELGSNFLADRLLVERKVLLGAAPAGGSDLTLPFPITQTQLDAMRGRLPRAFDWRKRGGVTHVRNQGLCASCWAFATTGAVEGALFLQTGRLVALSEQTLIDCGMRNGANGCKPTWPSRAFSYIKDNGLPALEEYTPYKAEVLQCRADRVPPVTRISGYTDVTPNNMLALKVAIKKYGPTVVLIDGQAASLASYKKDFYHDARCRNDSSNHAVLAVGWTTHRGESYFILKNSWGTGWGEEGYVRMRASTNTCGVLRMPSVPIVSGRDVQRVPAASPSAATPPARST